MQASPEPVFAKPKPICYCFRPIRIQNLRFNPIRAFVLFLINGSGDPLSLLDTCFCIHKVKEIFFSKTTIFILFFSNKHEKAFHYRDVPWLSADSWKWKFCFRNFFTGTSQDHLGSSPKTIGSTWIGQLVIFALAWPFGLRFWLGVSQIDRTDC